MTDDVDILHFGVKGMKWGQRKAERGGVSRSVDRTARKDAEEFARAKMFYGEGAGTRRKLINKSVEAKKAHDPSYAKAFDRHLNNQDYSTHASKAVSERNRADRKSKNKKRFGAAARRITGEPGTQAAIVGLAFTGVAYLNSPKGRATMQKAYNSMTGAIENAQRAKGAAKLADYFAKNSF